MVYKLQHDVVSRGFRNKSTDSLFLAATPQRFKSLPAVRPQVCPMHSTHALLLLALYGEAKEGKYTCPGECYGQNDEYMCTIKIKR